MKRQIDIHRPEPVTVSIFGADYRLRFLTRGDVIDVIRALVKSGFASELGLAALKGEILINAVAGCEEAISLTLERSFPDFKEWDEVPLSGQMELLMTIWDANDGPGIIANFSRMTQAQEEAPTAERTPRGKRTR